MSRIEEIQERLVEIDDEITDLDITVDLNNSSIEDFEIKNDECEIMKISALEERDELQTELENLDEDSLNSDKELQDV